jgi:hypothetical protein
MGDILLHNGQTAETLVNRRVREWFYSNLETSRTNEVYVVPNYSRKEMWVCFPETGNTVGYANLALVWNWAENTWGVRDLQNFPHIGFGIALTAGTSESFDDSVGVAFDDDIGPFGERAYQPQDYQLVAGSAENNELLRVDFSRQFSGENYHSYVERTGLALVGYDHKGQPTVDVNAVKFIRAVYPKVKADPGTILNIYVGSQQTANGPVSWTGPYLFNCDTDSKIDCRVSGKYMAIKFEDNGFHGWGLEGYTLDMDIIGRF